MLPHGEYLYLITNRSHLVPSEITSPEKSYDILSKLILLGFRSLLKTVFNIFSWFSTIFIHKSSSRIYVSIKNYFYRNVIEYQTCEAGGYLQTDINYSNATREWYLNKDGTIITYCETEEILVIQSDRGEIILSNFEESKSLTYFEVFSVLNNSSQLLE